MNTSRRVREHCEDVVGAVGRPGLQLTVGFPDSRWARISGDLWDEVTERAGRRSR